MIGIVGEIQRRKTKRSCKTCNKPVNKGDPVVYVACGESFCNLKYNCYCEKCFVTGLFEVIDPKYLSQKAKDLVVLNKL
jgi:hypothetical protein